MYLDLDQYISFPVKMMEHMYLISSYTRIIELNENHQT